MISHRVLIPCCFLAFPSNPWTFDSWGR